MRTRLRCFMLMLLGGGFCTVAMLITTRLAAAQSNSNTIDVQVNMPYAVQFGFGSYDVGGLSVDVYRIPLTQTFDLGPEPGASRLVLTHYLGYGRASFETHALGHDFTASQDFVFLLPHAELHIPVRKGWTLKPYLEAGVVKPFSGSVAIDGQRAGNLDEKVSYLWGAGLGSVFEAPVGDFLLSFGAKLGAAGEAASRHSTGYGTFQTGAEARHALPGVAVDGFTPDIGVSFVYYHFFPPARFSLPAENPLEVSDQFEFGVSIGSAKPAKLLIFDNPRLGVSYRFGDGLTGVRLDLGFAF